MSRPISPFPGEAPVHYEGGWEAAGNADPMRRTESQARAGELPSKRPSGEDVQPMAAEGTAVRYGWGHYFRAGKAGRGCNNMDRLLVRSLRGGQFRRSAAGQAAIGLDGRSPLRDGSAGADGHGVKGAYMETDRRQ